MKVDCDWLRRFGHMHHNFKDLTGETFGKLTAIRPVQTTGKAWVWEFRCECGALVYRSGKEATHAVQKGYVPQCRQCAKDATSKRQKTHGMTNTPLYNVWHSMMLRCFTPTYPTYRRYGGRGITVCEKWRTFEGFYEDVHATYQRGLVLDRINNDGNYCPENCRWTTYKENGRNRAGVYTEVDVKALAKASGVSASTIWDRIHSGWPLERLTAPLGVPLKQYAGQHEYKRKYMTSSTADQDTDLSFAALKDRS